MTTNNSDDENQELNGNEEGNVDTNQENNTDTNENIESGKNIVVKDSSNASIDLVSEEKKNLLSSNASVKILDDSEVQDLEGPSSKDGSKTSVQVVEESEVQDVEKESSTRGSKEIIGVIEDSGFQDAEKKSSPRGSKEEVIGVIEDSGMQDIDKGSSIRGSKEVIGVIEDSGIEDVEEKQIESGRKELTEESRVQDVEQQPSKGSKESKSMTNRVQKSSLTSQKDTNLTNFDVLSEKGDTDEREMSPIIEYASTDCRSQSTISKIDSEIYDQPIRMVNTDAENTPNQDNVTVKFVASSDVTFTHAFNLSSTIQDIKQQISELIRVDAKSIMLSKDGYDVDDWLPLAGLGVEAFGCIELTITSTDPNQKIIGIIDENIPTIDVITVHVLQDDGSFKDIIVEIHDEAYCKLWLGGYRNRKTKVEYHHAYTQTLPKPRKIRTKLDNPPDTYEYFLFHRDTQTPLKPKNIGVDMPANKATQMNRSDCLIPSKDDKIITAKIFETYDEWMIRNKVLEKIITLQRNIRTWLRHKNYTSITLIQKQIMQEMQDQKLQLLQEQLEKKRRMITGAAFPSKRDDFYMLYLMVGKWWQKEQQRIKELRTEEPKKAEYCALLEKEITLLSAIEKHRIEVKKESLRKEEMRFLEMTSRPIIFRNANGGMISIDNPPTQTAKEFKELYSTLISDELSSTERIDLLLTFKNMMQLYVLNEFEFAKELRTLIEREINLLVIGLKGKELSGIRKRIEQLFMYFLHQPQFNPKVESYRKSNWPKTVDVMYKCTRCSKLLPVSGYPVHTRMEKLAVCKSCDWLQNIGHQRIDMSPYLKMLKQIQNSEMQQCCYSSICFVFQQKGAYFLVNTIWHGHSAISECRVLSSLRLVRWIKNIEWSPWNNILLTEEEAKCHNNIENVFEFYDQSFIDSVRQKHILARVHFISLLKTDYHLRSTGAWENITDSGPYIHPSHVAAFAQGE